MGWSSGSALMSDIIGALKAAKTPAKGRAEVYAVLIPAFENMDCDTLYECEDEDPAFKKAMRKLYPDTE